MKNSFYFTMLFVYLFTLTAHAQKDTIWYDTNWNKTTKSKATFYRIDAQKKAKGFWFVDYYCSGAKQMEGLSLDKDNEIYDGTVKWYHENGNTFQVINYKKGVLDGKREIYHENGKLKSKSIYKNGKINGIVEEFYDNGVLKETGNYRNGERDGHWKVFYENGKLKEEGKYKNGIKVDIWKTFYYDGSVQE